MHIGRVQWSQVRWNIKPTESTLLDMPLVHYQVLPLLHWSCWARLWLSRLMVHGWQYIRQHLVMQHLIDLITDFNRFAIFSFYHLTIAYRPTTPTYWTCAW